MTEDEVSKIIVDAIAGSLGVAPDEVRYERGEDLDSVSFISVLVALDEAFDGKVATIEEIGNTFSAGGIIDTLRKNELVD